MEQELSLDELDAIIDEILSEQELQLDESVVEQILNEEMLEESMSTAVKEFLDAFDKKAAKALEQKTLEAIAKKHGVNATELKKVVAL